MKLNSEQKELLVQFRAEYLAHGLSCEPADMPRAAAAIRRAYAIKEKAVPEIIYAASPMQAMQIIAQDKVSSPGLLKPAKPIYVNTSLWGNMEIYWIAKYIFPLRYLGKIYKKHLADKLDLMHEISLSCGWWYPFENACIVCDRPEFIKKDENRLLHGEAGPAVRYRDGFEMYAWHGTRIPKQWIAKPKTLTAKQAITWKDTDQRTAACQILGWAAILEELDAKIIHADENPYIGTLYNAILPNHGPQNFLKARCGTGVDVVILASNKARTAREAGAMSYGITEAEYNPAFRT